MSQPSTHVPQRDELSSQLILTAQGQKWLQQFDPIDQETAKLLARSLILVSHNEFRRNLENHIKEQADGVDGPVALYAVRELEKDQTEPNWNRKVIPFFEQATQSSDGKTVSSVSNSSDQGSEAIVASIIRQLSNSNPKKYLNHPSKKSLLDAKCDKLFFIDDFIGSGCRVSEFLDSFWMDRTIVSWRSSKHILLSVITYSGTGKGIDCVAKHRFQPEVIIHRDTPALSMLPISQEKRNSVYQLCHKYGRRELSGRGTMWFGYQKSMASLVFEHGCPNNTPAILWDPDKKQKNWVGLFPNRTIDTSTTSVFPYEIVQGDPVQTLHDVGQKRLAISGALLRRGKIGRLVLVVLGLVANGQRRRAAIGYATGLSVEECERLISRCVNWEFISSDRRITPKGLAELAAAKIEKKSNTGYLEIGTDYYYPKKLRATTN